MISYVPNVVVAVGAGDASFVSSQASIVSSTVDVTLFDEFGNSIQPESISICFETEDRNISDLCLGSFNEKTREWKCDDPCLQDSNGNICSNADHLTNFALLLKGGSGVNGDCGNTEGDYILGSTWEDFYLIIACVAGCCILSIIFILFGIFCRPCTELILGQEGIRISGLRNRKTLTKIIVHS